MQYEDEYVAGVERDIGKGFVVSARYIDRRLRRVVEDMSGISPEAFNVGFGNQVYLIGNPLSSTDLFVNGIAPTVQPQGTACPSSSLATGDTDHNGFPYANGLDACFS